VLIRYYQKRAQERQQLFPQAGDPQQYRSLARSVDTRPQTRPVVAVQELDFLAKVPRRR
jgi:hypothetical protein